MQAAAYILKVSKDRRNVLLNALTDGPFSSYDGKGRGSEPVDVFDHRKKAPLIVFICFHDKEITHIADGRKGMSAGTGLVRLNMENLEQLERPIKLSRLVAAASPRTKAHLKRIVANGGKLPPKSLGSVIDTMIKLLPSLSKRLERFSEKRWQRIAGFSARARDNLAFQKEGLGLALEISDVGTEEISGWMPDDKSTTFLEGLTGTVREDAMLISDFSTIPGFKALNDAAHLACKTFINPNNPSTELTVIMANRFPLEQQTGSDLIYYNKKYHSFVMVQYKAMERKDLTSEFRWQEGDQFTDEIKRMDNLWAELEKIPNDRQAIPEAFRLNHNPFFFKFCPRAVFDPDDRGLFKGFYLPLGYWKDLNEANYLKGPKKGNVITFENVVRKLSNTDFIMVVANSWVGTTPNQSSVLEKIIKQVLASGKTVTFAIKEDKPPKEGLDDYI